MQEAIGVSTNYTSANNDIYWVRCIAIPSYDELLTNPSQAFQSTGDFVYETFMEDLESLLAQDVRVSLLYGDADYICNWFGGEAVSLAVNYTYADEFRAAGYAPMIVDGTEYGEVRQYGNFSFLRVYEAGHLIPYYQPLAALAAFNRTLMGMDIATGEEIVTSDYDTEGNAEATHTEPYVPLPSETSNASTTAALKKLAEPVHFRG